MAGPARITAALLVAGLALVSTGCGAARRSDDGGGIDAAGSDGACVGSCHLTPGCHFTDPCHCGGLVCDDGGSASDLGSGPDLGPPPPSCPAAAPTDGSTCPLDGQTCTYDACPGAGVATAACTGSTWHVTTVACGSHMCNDGSTCAADQVCVSRQSGAIIFSCQPNPCAGAAFDCTCAASLCSGGTCSTSGTSVTCVIDCGGCP